MKTIHPILDVRPDPSHRTYRRDRLPTDRPLVHPGLALGLEW
jgi:hypothetical protein